MCDPEPGVFGTLLARGLVNGSRLPRPCPDRSCCGDAPPIPMARDAGAPSAGVGPPARDEHALRIVVDRDGPVAVTGAELATAGWDLDAIDPGDLLLTVGGVPAALQVVAATGPPEARLAPTDRILFHGRAQTGPYTRENVYWLQPRGAGPRIVERRSAGDAPVAASFDATWSFEEDTTYVASLRADEGPDRWVWGPAVTAGTTTTRDIALTYPARAPATVTLALQGYTSDDDVRPDHHIVARLNDWPVADETFDGRRPHEIAGTVPAGVLRNGANTIELTAAGDTGARVDSVFLDRVTVRGRGLFRAEGDRLDFAPDTGGGSVSISGLSSPDAQLWAVPTDAPPVAVGSLAVRRTGGGYTAVVSGLERGEPYVLFGPRALQRPLRIEANELPDPDLAARGVDYLVVAPRAFQAALAPLAARRAGQGLRVGVVDIQDVYDAESDGVFDPRALKRYLGGAYRAWPRPAPSYVLLVGDATLDYRGGYGSVPRNQVPSVQVNLESPNELGAATSDLWYGQLEGDDPLPEVLVGRFPARTATDVTTMVEKTLAFDKEPVDAGWRGRSLFVTGEDAAGAFTALADQLTSTLPDPNGAVRLDASATTPDTDLPTEIARSIDEGALALTYVGHGNVDLWAPWHGGGRLFDVRRIHGLANAPRTPLFVTATCMNGWFDHPLVEESMAEAWLRQPAGGGVVAWAPSGFSDLTAQSTLYATLFDGLYRRPAPIGALAAAASAATYADGASTADLLRSLVLFGDPSLVVAAPSSEAPWVLLPSLAVP